MWHNDFNNNMMSDRGDRESEANIEIMLRSLPERAHWFEPAYVEPFEGDTIYQQQPTYFQQEQENFQPFESSNEEVDYGCQQEYDQHEPFNHNFSYQQEPIYSHQQQEYLQPYESSYGEMEYVGDYEYQYESNPYFSYEDPHVEQPQGNEEFDIKSMLRQILENQKQIVEEIKQHTKDVIRGSMEIKRGSMEMKNELELRSMELKSKVDRDFIELNGKAEEIASHLNMPSNLIAQASNEDDIEEIPHVEDMDFEDEACDFGSNVENVALEGDVFDVFPTNFEVVFEPQEEITYTQQRSICEEEVEEIIHLVEDALIGDTLLDDKASKIDEKKEEENVHHEDIFERVDHFIHLLEEALIEDALMHYVPSKVDKKVEEEEEVVQLYELPPKVPHEDSGTEQGVFNSPTPSSKQPQGLRERLEWKIKHRRKMKPPNV